MAMITLIKSITSAILFVLIAIVTLFSENAAQAWFPQKGELSGISTKSAVIIDFIALIILAIIVYYIVRLFN
jgi:hypothetical protein